MNPHDPTRRRLLKGAALGAGGSLLSPMLARLQAEAGGGEAPRRFVFVVEGNGLPPAQVHPPAFGKLEGREKRGAFAESSLNDVPLPAALAPIEAWKPRVTILQGLSGRVCGGGHSNNFGALGAYNARGGVGPPETPPIRRSTPRSPRRTPASSRSWCWAFPTGPNTR